MSDAMYDDLVELLQNNEDHLMQRILEYAETHGYTKYTSTLKEAWRLSISGLTASIVKAMEQHRGIPSLAAEENLLLHESAQFGIVEARRHRERGVSLNMFFSLLKYYRQSYIDVLNEHADSLVSPVESITFVNRVFDIVEAGLCQEWAGGDEQRKIHEMQIRNMAMTNEKNKYLTIFESLPNPVFIISPDGLVENLNLAAAVFLQEDSIAGGQYYHAALHSDENQIGNPAKRYIGEKAIVLLPWFAEEIEASVAGDVRESSAEKKIIFDASVVYYRVKTSQMLDVSKKFSGSIFILEDITSLKTAQDEILTLTGLVPICSHCKKIRDDKGYWNRVEEYIEQRSTAYFSHSICNECLVRYYDMDE